MANAHKAKLLLNLQRFGKLAPIPSSQSLFTVGDNIARIYIRYSKIHSGGRTFFGLRDRDLRLLDGHLSFLCLLLDDGSEPLFIPYSDFEQIFRQADPAADGQYKVQLIPTRKPLELYVAKQGRFNVEGYVGYDSLKRYISQGLEKTPVGLTHAQVQTLLAGIGHVTGHSVWVPDNNVGSLDWTLTKHFPVAKSIPKGYEQIASILQEVDVIWTRPGSNQIDALFEVEHSTPIYSGLLRFNDIFLTSPSLNRFTIVSNESRRDFFARQVRRPTFLKSGLSEITAFLEYSNVYNWHSRLSKNETGTSDK